jgi:GAF domain-containing protein
MLKKEFGFFWVGFYMHQHEQQLTIGPYQGELPCFFIPFGKGVCGNAALEGKTVIVPNVAQYPGYIACHPEPRSEIVVPAMWQGECAFVLDIDHIEANYFDMVDAEMLEMLCKKVLTYMMENHD